MAEGTIGGSISMAERSAIRATRKSSGIVESGPMAQSSRSGRGRKRAHVLIDSDDDDEPFQVMLVVRGR
jgi:hypothetical protein